MNRLAPTPAAAPGTEPRRRAAVALALAGVGVAAAVVAWIALASATGLVYHFLPGATFLAGAWVFRQAAPSRRASLPELAAIAAAGATGTVLGVVLVTGIGRELDTAPVTSLVAASGALIAAVWLRRGAAPAHDGPWIGGGA